MNAVSSFFESGPQLGRGGSADNSCEIGISSRSNPYLEIAHPEPFHTLVFVSLERIASERLDGRQHPRNHVGVLIRFSARGNVQE